MMGFHPQCRDALTVRQKLISQDYRVSYSLAKACKLDLRKQRCSLDTSLPRAREARLSYLLLCLEAAVHRGEKPPPIMTQSRKRGINWVLQHAEWCSILVVYLFFTDTT